MNKRQRKKYQKQRTIFNFDLWTEHQKQAAQLHQRMQPMWQQMIEGGKSFDTTMVTKF